MHRYSLYIAAQIFLSSFNVSIDISTVQLIYYYAVELRDKAESSELAIEEYLHIKAILYA
jgi:hypothetical protein